MKAAPFLAWVVLGLHCQAASRVQHFTPRAVVPGHNTVLTFSGSGLDEATNLWTSFGAQARRLAETNSGPVRFAVNCPPIPNGVYALQLSGKDGASDYHLLMVDHLSVQSHDLSHQTRGQAVLVEPPVAIDSSLKAEQSDYYSFHSQEGDRLSIEVIAHRIGSEMDPVVRVLDSQGNELAFCDDEPGVYRDARFVFAAPVKGDYFLEVHDAAFGGGSKFDYRLRLTRDPLVWMTFPLSDPAEASVSFEELGTELKRGLRSPADPPRKPGLGVLPQVVESPSVVSPPLITFPSIINGRISDGADIDLFAFPAGKDERLIFQSQTRSLGSPCDLVLTVKSREGKVLAQSDPKSAGDAAVTNRFSEAGQYLLEVRELSGSALANAPYRIRAMPYRPGVAGSAASNQLACELGETATLRINLTRSDFSGPVTVSLDPKVEGVTLESATIPENKNEADVKIKISPPLRPGDLIHFKVKLGAGDSIESVSTLAALRKSFPLMLQPPESLTSLIGLFVKPSVYDSKAGADQSK